MWISLKLFYLISFQICSFIISGQIWYVSAIISLNIFSAPFFFLLSLQDSNSINVRLFIMVPQVTGAQVVCLFASQPIFSLFKLVYTVLNSGSLILSTVPSSWYWALLLSIFCFFFFSLLLKFSLYSYLIYVFIETISLLIFSIFYLFQACSQFPVKAFLLWLMWNICHLILTSLLSSCWHVLIIFFQSVWELSVSW